MPEVLTELREITTAPRIRVLTEAEAPAGDRKFLHFIAEVQRADTKNRNGRVYPRSILEREVERFQTAIQERTAFGEADHPEGIPSVNRTAVLWEKLWMDEDGVVQGQAKVLETDAGRNVRAILEGGGQIGTSSRSRGSVSVKEWQGEQVEMVNEDLELTTFDMVINQSVPTALPKRIFLEQKESKMFTTLDEMKKDAPELHKQLWAAAIEEASRGLEKEFQRVLDDKVAEVRESLKTEMLEAAKADGTVMDEATKATSKLHAEVVEAIVDVIREAGLIEETVTITEAESKKIIEALQEENETLKGENEKLGAALTTCESAREVQNVKEAVAEKTKGHPLQEVFAATLLDVCPSVKVLEEKFEAYKTRFDTLAQNQTQPAAPAPAGVGRSIVNPKPEKAPIVEQAAGEKPKVDPAALILQRMAGIRPKA